MSSRRLLMSDESIRQYSVYIYGIIDGASVSDCTVILTVDGETFSNYSYFDDGTTVQYSISKSHYNTETGSITINGDNVSLGVSLTEAPKVTVTVTPTLNTSDPSTHPANYSNIRVIVSNIPQNQSEEEVNELIVPNSSDLIQFERWDGDTVKLTIVCPHFTGISESVLIQGDANLRQTISKTLTDTDEDKYLSMMTAGNTGTIKWVARNASYPKKIQYSTNNGTTWTTLTSSVDGSTSTLQLTPNTIYRFKYDPSEKDNTGNISYGTEVSNNIYENRFELSTDTYVWGNITSLIPEDIDTFANAAFQRLFGSCVTMLNHPLYELYLNINKVRYASCRWMFQSCRNLVRPPIWNIIEAGAGYGCYSTFSGCQSLIYTPIIYDVGQSTALPQFSGCFNECEKLSNVFCFATNISFTSYGSSTQGWLTDASSTGTFYCAPASEMSQQWPRNNAGIPQDWSVVERNPYPQT